MRNLYLVACLVVLIGAAYATGTRFTAQLDEDTFVSKASPDANFIDNSTLWVTSEGGHPTSETYLGFVNTLGSQGLSTPKNVESAVLKLNATDVRKPGIITAYFVDSATLSSTTWSNKVDYDKEANSTVSIDGVGSYTIDATPLIKKAVETCTDGCPYSIVLVASGDVSVGFASKENPDKGKTATLEYTTVG